MLILQSCISKPTSVAVQRQAANIADLPGVHIASFNGPHLEIALNKRGQFFLHRMEAKSIDKCLRLRYHTTQDGVFICGFANRKEMEAWVTFVAEPYMVECMIDECDLEIYLKPSQGNRSALVEDISNQSVNNSRYMMTTLMGN